MSIDIIYEDSSITVIRKPAGVATQSANPTQPDCVSLLKEHLKKEDPENKKEPYIGVIHRLDQPVEGILVFAKNRQAAASLSKQVQSDIMNKHYLALVEGIVDVPKETELVDLMYKDPKLSKAVIADDKDPGKDGGALQYAKLTCHTQEILEEKNMTILSITLITGRFHQIRAQLSHIGHPIVGDRKYGASSSYQKGIALAADRLEFRHPKTGEKVEKIVDFSFCL